MTETLLTLREAAEALGILVRTLDARVERGQVPSAVKAPKKAGGMQWVWMVPADGLDTLPQMTRHYTPRAIGDTMLRGAGRCDCCSIILERSGDGKHQADASDAGRCWWCRATYGEGGKG